MKHLSMLELAAEVERVAGLSSPDEWDANREAHLRDCALCRQRVSSLHGQDMQVARALQAEERELPEPEPYDLDRMVDSMMDRLRADVEAKREAAKREISEAAGEATPKDTRAGKDPSRGRPGAATIGVMSFAAGIGFAFLVPGMRATLATPAANRVVLVSTGREEIRDSVRGFEGKEYKQRVRARSGVNLVVQGINSTDFDCELYDTKQPKPVAVDNGIRNTCRFSIIATEAGEYRLVVKNRTGAATSYTMLAQVLSEAQVRAERPNESGATVSEPLPPTQ